MERSTELLYWFDFRQFIHYDEETDTFFYDPELPERARKSFELWRKQKALQREENGVLYNSE